MSLTSAAASGTELDALKELRDDLASRMEVCTSDQNYGTLASRFKETLERITVIEGRAKSSGGTALDELAKRRRAAGRPNSTSSARAPRSS